jgi:Tfp pilus assembly protein PilX
MRLLLAIRHTQRGVVLPIVLIVMMVVTMLIVTQVRRGTVDERLAGNWSRAISGQTAAESVLRWCEAVVLNTESRLWDGVLPSENFVATPAWRSNIQANLIKTVPANDLPTGATVATCIIEDATNELGGDQFQGNTDMGTAGIRDRYLRKFRFTTAVTFADATAFGNVTYRSQSEVRNLIQ